MYVFARSVYGCFVRVRDAIASVYTRYPHTKLTYNTRDVCFRGPISATQLIRNLEVIVIGTLCELRHRDLVLAVLVWLL